MLSDKEQMLTVAQAIRYSHCDRAKQGHKCQGTCTITPDEVLLSCPLCGNGSSHNKPFFDDRERDIAERLLMRVGITWDNLSVQSQCDFMLGLREIIKAS